MKKDYIESMKNKAVNLLNMGYKEEQNSYKHDRYGAYDLSRIESESSQYHIGLAYGIEMCLIELGYDITDLQNTFSDLQKERTQWIENFINEKPLFNDIEYEL